MEKTEDALKFDFKIILMSCAKSKRCYDRPSLRRTRMEEKDKEHIEELLDSHEELEKTLEEALKEIENR